MKERSIIFSAPMVRAILEGRKTQTRQIVKPQPIDRHAPDSSWIRPCDVGDRLWVKEKWSQSPFGQTSLTFYGADHEDDPPHIAKCARWSPSVHMPRWASRITLEVTGVRVERLQDISEADAIAEGIESTGYFFECPCWRDYMEPDPDLSSFPDDPVGSYASLWESIYGPDSWDQNPWVWVIEFKRVEGGQ